MSCMRLLNDGLTTSYQNFANEDSSDWYKTWEHSSQWPSTREWLTCPASPGRQLCHLVPPLFFKVVAFHTSDGLRCLAPNHHHQLEGQKWKHLNEQPLHNRGFKMSNKDIDVESVRMKMGGRAGGETTTWPTFNKHQQRGHKLEYNSIQ